MALVLKDRVKETSSSSGAGSITLGGAFPGYQTFNAAIATGSTVYYTIHNLTAGFDTEWEVGLGTFTSPATLARNTVLSSSAGAPTKTNFTAGASGLEVFITQPAEEAVYLNQATGLVEVGGNGTNTVSFTNINASNVVMVSGTITTNASNATDITNKAYVDNLAAAGLTYHQAVQAASVSAFNEAALVYNNGASGVGATLTRVSSFITFVIDGYTPSVGQRVMIKDQTTQSWNGIYTVTATGSPSAGFVLTRATDADTYGPGTNQLSLNSYFFVQNGTVNKGTAYVLSAPAGTITFGTSNLQFSEFSSAQVYAAGTGLNLSSLTFSIANTAVTAATYGDSGNVAQVTVNAQGQLTNAANVSINASSISVGTLANGRTTADSANGASTIVLRDANGSFSANVVTATTGSFTNITGNGIALTAINASNITSGTLDNARTTGSTSNSASTIVLRDASGNFGSNVISAASFSGDGTAITAINASNLSSGTVANARTTASSSNGASTIVLRDSAGDFSAGVITANGSALSAINASNVSSGTLLASFGGTGIASPGTANNVLTSNGSGWISAAPASGGQYFGNAAVKAIAYNASSINENITMTYSGMSVGPITIGSGYSVTVNSGIRWVVL